MNRIGFILFLSLLSLPFLLKGQNLPEGFSASVIADSLNPVAMTFDHHGRIWLAQKDGRILILDENEEVLPDPFLEIEVDDFNERGLVGLALHPDMHNHPYVYVYYTVPGERHNRLSRFRSNGDRAVPGSEEILLELDELEGSVHNGGAMVFDNEGYLFLATGEAGIGSNSQDSSNLLGKILRLRDDGTIPSGNPYYDDYQGKNRAIWSMGLRNPFNMHYDKRRDIIYATDVGASDYEEINIIEAGKNYGWPIIEGPLKDQNPPENYQDPLHYYPHSEGCAIVGMAVFQTQNNAIDSTYRNGLFFADYCHGYIKYLKNGDPDSVKTFASNLERPLHILIDEFTGNVYFLTRAGIGGGSTDDNTATDEGRLWKLFFKGDGIPNVVVPPSSMRLPVGEEAYFNTSAVGSDTLFYKWFVNDSLVQFTTSNQLTLQNVQLSDDQSRIHCIVENQEGADTSDTAILTVLDDHRPEPEILFPTKDFAYSAGDTIHFRGIVTDKEDGVIDSSKYVWKIDFHHDNHTHPFIEKWDSVASGSFVFPVAGEPDTNTWVRIYLSATDSAGLKGTTYREIFPDLSNIYLRGRKGLKVNIDGLIRTLPFQLPTIINLERTIAVPEHQIYKDHIYHFSEWSDEYPSRIRTIQGSENVDTFEIYFDSLALGNGSGLYAEYFNDWERLLMGVPDLIRIDSVIDFHWGSSSPDTGVIRENGFTARWRGFLEPLYSEEYEFSIFSDDGHRLWINDTLLLDHWEWQSGIERKANIELKAGVKYRFHVEYFEGSGRSNIELKWSSKSIDKKIIPFRQLYPMTFGSIHARVWHDKNQDGVIQEESEEYIPNAVVLLLTASGKYVDHKLTDQDGSFRFDNYEIGEYYTVIVLPDKYNELEPKYGFSHSNRTESFTIATDSLIETRYGFVGELTQVISPDHKVEPLIIYPNPSLGTFQIITDSSTNGEIQIFNFEGKKIQPSTIHWYSPRHGEINLEGHPPGIYTLLLSSEDNFYRKKIVLLR